MSTPTDPTAFSEDQRKHLEMIQAVITRMAANSFAIRGWTVTLVSALLALAAKDADRMFVLMAYFPCVIFWLLGTYYLRMERHFRSLYNAASAAKDQTTVPLYSMNIVPTVKPTDTWGTVFFSETMLLFYPPLLAVMSAIMCLFWNAK